MNIDKKTQLAGPLMIINQMSDYFRPAEHFESPARYYLRHLNIINDSITELRISLDEDPDKHRPSDLRYDLAKVIEGLEKMQLDIELVLNALEGE